MSTRLVRWPVAAAVVDAVKEHPSMSGVQVTSVNPGKNVEPQSVHVGQIEGALAYPHSSAGRANRDETFVIPLQIRVHTPGQDVDVCRNRTEELLANVEDIFAEINTTVFRAQFGLLELEAADPVSEVQDTTIGPLGFARIDLIGQARLS